MPIYKSGGKKDGLQRYRVRVALTDAEGHARQIERVAYGLENAKAIECELIADKRQIAAGSTITLAELTAEYNQSRLKSVRETSRAKNIQVQNKYILPMLGEQRIDRLPPPCCKSGKIHLRNAIWHCAPASASTVNCVLC